MEYVPGGRRVGWDRRRRLPRCSVAVGRAGRASARVVGDPVGQRLESRRIKTAVAIGRHADGRHNPRSLRARPQPARAGVILSGFLTLIQPRGCPNNLRPCGIGTERELV